MDKINKPLLSICIPTYNRCISLKFCLDKLLDACKDLEHSVEIIVSDNASNDETENIITDLVLQNKNLKYFRNNTNLGFNNNIFLLTDKYSEGDFCWLIGDDDFVDKDAVRTIISLIRENSQIDFVGINFRLKPLNPLNKNDLHPRDNNIFKSIFPSVVNKMSRPGNLFITFISASIFRRDKFVSFPKGAFNKDSWQNFFSTFPHSYIQLSVFKDSEAIYIEDELLTATIHEKTWHYMNSAIYLYSIPSLYKYSLEIGYAKRLLKDSYNQIMAHAIRQIPKRIDYKHVNLKYRSKFILNEILNFRFYICGIKIVKEKLFFK